MTAIPAPSGRWARMANPPVPSMSTQSGITVAADSAAGGPDLPCTLRWNGRRWASVSVAHPGEGNQNWGFEAVTSTGHSDLTAVGSAGSAGSASVGEALYGTWNGRSWSLGTGPDITQLNAVSPGGSGTLWAVGSETASDHITRPVVQVSG